MNSSFNFLRRACLATALVFPGVYLPQGALAHAEGKQGAIAAVVDFDASTWGKLLSSGPRPTAYVFTNSFCSTCPDAFETLHQTVLASGKRVEISAILMDVQGQRALVHAQHYVGITKLYAFDGFEPAIRQAVDPAWRNITPYLVLVGKNGKLQRVTGQPDAKTLKAWLE